MNPSNAESEQDIAWTIDFARFACRLAGADEDEWQGAASIAILQELRRMAAKGIRYVPHWCRQDWLIGRAIRAVNRARRAESASCAVGLFIASVAECDDKQGALEAADWWAMRSGLLNAVEHYALERIAQGDTYGDLAEDLVRSPAACRKLVERARKKLRGHET